MLSLFGDAKGANLIEYALLVCAVGMISVGVFSGNITALATMLHATQGVMEQASAPASPAKQSSQAPASPKSAQPEEWRNLVAGIFVALVVAMAVVGVYIIWSIRP